MTSDTTNPYILLHKCVAPYYDIEGNPHEYAQNMREVAYFLPGFSEVKSWAARALEYILRGIGNFEIVELASDPPKRVFEIVASQKHLFVARCSTRQIAENALSTLLEYEEWYKANKPRPIHHVSFDLTKQHLVVIAITLMYRLKCVKVKNKNILWFLSESGNVSIQFGNYDEMLEFLSLPCFNPMLD